MPLADIIETDSEFIIELEMPSVSKENIDINVENDVLTIQTKIDFGEKTSLNYITQEFTLENFKRSFNLNNSVNIEKIRAQTENGILKLTLPKSEEIKLKKIEIKTE